ncbi:putative hydrolase YcaC [Paraburkholderia ultramafica]|uniref:Putative hydrolase YcaC n=1 Tax=Paraburkholderia ultramafica TaxID=1544867 RepID=A0A6S7BJU6_9BURK|nr:isochorismatase family protein [Paraburkholderia ultramafica]CAB3802946.1 putative hydrolase YcaC [Paraburkholderia ultramafica]
MSYDRLTAENAALLLIDHQTGLSNGIQDQSVPEYMTAVTGLVKLAKILNLPTVASTSASSGPNGPLLPIIPSLLPDAPVIHRPGQVNAWDNQEFVEAVRKTGRKKLIVAGVSTEVCVAFVSLSAVKAGYDVYAVIDASGTWNKLVQEVAIARLAQAGVVPMTWVAVLGELLGDWSQPLGQEIGVVMMEHLPFYGNLYGSFLAAKGSAQ